MAVGCVLVRVRLLHRFAIHVGRVLLPPIVVAFLTVHLWQTSSRANSGITSLSFRFGKASSRTILMKVMS